jgi:hypothetical protein
MRVLELAAGQQLFRSAIAVLDDVAVQCSQIFEVSANHGPPYRFGANWSVTSRSSSSGTQQEMPNWLSGSNTIEAWAPVWPAEGYATGMGSSYPSHTLEAVKQREVKSASTDSLLQAPPMMSRSTPALLHPHAGVETSGTSALPNLPDLSTLPCQNTTEISGLLEGTPGIPMHAERDRQALNGSSATEQFPWQAWDSAHNQQDLAFCLRDWLGRQSPYFS